MSATTILDREWTYRNAGWPATWTATHQATGQVVETGAGHIDQARAYTAAVAPVTDTAPTAIEYTIASGPQRARAGHQRYTTAFTAA